MKKNGFTLVELLAVIVILAILLTVAIPNVIGITQRVKEKMYCSKVSDIESAAKLYGQDYIDEVESNGNTMTIHVYTLIENNLYKKESDDCILNSNDKYCVSDPRDDSKMDDKTITLTKKDKRITATFNYNNDADKNSCTK